MTSGDLGQVTCCLGHMMQSQSVKTTSRLRLKSLVCIKHASHRRRTLAAAASSTHRQPDLLLQTFTILRCSLHRIHRCGARSRFQLVRTVAFGHSPHRTFIQETSFSWMRSRFRRVSLMSPEATHAIFKPLQTSRMFCGYS